MFHIVLHQPEIPPNTGNVIRLCANTGAHLHLVEPLGFLLTDKELKRAGMDYSELVGVATYADWVTCCAALSGHRMFAVTTRGNTRYDQVSYQAGDVFVFGSESRGLPDAVRESFVPEMRLRIPMQPQNRSVNLSNSVAVVAYEAWRQQGFATGL